MVYVLRVENEIRQELHFILGYGKENKEIKRG